MALHVEGLFAILRSQCRAPLSRKLNMNSFFFFFSPSVYCSILRVCADVWGSPAGFRFFRGLFPSGSCSSVGPEIVYKWLGLRARIRKFLTSLASLILWKFHSSFSFSLPCFFSTNIPEVSAFCPAFSLRATFYEFVGHELFSYLWKKYIFGILNRSSLMTRFWVEYSLCMYFTRNFSR